MKNDEKARELANCQNCIDVALKIKNVKVCNPDERPCENYKNLINMAEWKDEQAKRQFIDKAVRWLKDNALHYCYKSAFTGDAMIDINRLAERFEIAMQEK